MLQAQRRRFAMLRRGGPALIDAFVTAGVLIGAAVVLPIAVAPLFDDGAHPVPLVHPGANFCIAPAAARDTMIGPLTYRHCGEQHRETVLRP